MQETHILQSAILAQVVFEYAALRVVLTLLMLMAADGRAGGWRTLAGSRWVAASTRWECCFYGLAPLRYRAGVDSLINLSDVVVVFLSVVAFLGRWLLLA